MWFLSLMITSQSMVAQRLQKWWCPVMRCVVRGFGLGLMVIGCLSARVALAENPNLTGRIFRDVRGSVESPLSRIQAVMADVNSGTLPIDRPRSDSWFNLPRSPRYLLVDENPSTSEPDISKPGPDMGDYPNSAFTLPKGRIYIESAPFTLASADAENPASYNWPFMLRYGLTDNVELRLIGSGLTSVYSQPDTVVGFSPLILDTKVHLWDDQMTRLIPAASLEVFVQTNWGSPDFQGGVQPSLNLNLDFPVTQKTNIEMTFGYTGVQDAVSVITGHRFIPRFGHIVPSIHKANLNVNQFSYQWAIEHQLTERLQVFVHGYYNGPILLQSGPGKVVGVGYFFQLSKRSTLFNSYNAAVDQTAAPFSTQLGLAFAF